MISRSMHFAQILPGRGPFSRTRRERDACGAILASHGSVVAATRGTGTRAACSGHNADGDAGGARWARYGRGRGRPAMGAVDARLCRRDVRGRGAGTRLAWGGGAVGAMRMGGARWARCRCGQRGAQRGGRDAYRVLDGDDPDSDSWPDRRRCQGFL